MLCVISVVYIVAPKINVAGVYYSYYTLSHLLIQSYYYTMCGFFVREDHTFRDYS